MRGKTGCLMHQLEIVVCGEQLFATASIQYAIPLPARAVCSPMTGDATGRGPDALLAVTFACLKKMALAACFGTLFCRRFLR